MTAREVFEGMLIELSKVKAPSLLLEDFNYMFNKAIRLYTERQYSVYDTDQKTADTLRVLKSTAILDVKKTDAYNSMSVDGTSHLSHLYSSLTNLYGNTYEFTLPSDYLHMLNCICIFKVKKNHKCYNNGSYVSFAAQRLDSDKWGEVINDYYNRPEPKRPYYFIHNVNTSLSELTNPYTEIKDDSGEIIEIRGTDLLIIQDPITDADLDETETADSVKYPDSVTIDLGNNKTYDMDVRVLPAGSRHVNPQTVRCEIRYGKDDSIFELVKVSVDYLKAPLRIRLTPEQMDLTEDTSQIMEFPDYICQLILNELVMLVMENASDQRLTSNVSVNQTGVVLPTQTASTTNAAATA